MYGFVKDVQKELLHKSGTLKTAVLPQFLSATLGFGTVLVLLTSVCLCIETEIACDYC